MCMTRTRHEICWLADRGHPLSVKQHASREPQAFKHSNMLPAEFTPTLQQSLTCMMSTGHLIVGTH